MNDSLSAWLRPGRLRNRTSEPRAHRRPEFEICEDRTLLAVSIGDVTLLEGNSGTTSFVFTLTLNAPETDNVFVEVSTRDGTALAVEDYVPIAFQSVDFVAGQLTATVTVDVVGDLVREPDEFFYLDIYYSTIPVTDSEGLGEILNDDFYADLVLTHAPLPPSVPICDTFFASLELTNLGPDAATNIVLTDLIPANTSYVSASLSPMIPGSSINFVAGSLIVDIPSLGPNESVFLDIELQPTAIGLAINSADVVADEIDDNPFDNFVSESTTIYDPGVLGFEFATYTVFEDAGFATITVIRTGGSETPVSIFYDTTPGTAIPGVDYTPVFGTLNFDDGVTFQSFDIPIIDNSFFQSDRTVNLQLLSSTACPGGLETAVLDILDDDGIDITIEDTTVTEGPGVVADFPVFLSRAADTPIQITVQFATSNGTAQAGVDYVAVSGLVTFAPGDTLQYIPVQILDDLLLEGPETFYVTISDPRVLTGSMYDPPGGITSSAVVVTRPTATGTILDDDSLVVINTNDAGRGSLRRAILTANANPGLDRITFNIPGPGVQTILPYSPLPFILDYAVIDGYSQPGSRPNSQPIGSDAILLVEILGSNIEVPACGLVVSAGNSTIQGLAIGNFFKAAINVVAGGNNTIQGNYIGTDASGTQARPNALDGIHIVDSSDNLIGGTTPAARNLFSGNGSTGIQILGFFPLDNGHSILQTDSSRNVVVGNYIGTDVTGTRALPNGLAGVFVKNASANVIGGATPAARNIISGNLGVGVQLYLAGSTNNVVQGNFIGTDVTGTARLGNAYDGVFVNEAPANLIGGPTPGQGNLISANGSVGVQVLGAGAAGNVIQGNLIGTAVNGLAPLGNLTDGVYINGAVGTLVGGADPALANVISANAFSGVHLAAGASANVIQSNIIGAGINRSTPLGNAGYGVSLNDSAGNTVGGANGPNFIAFNRFGGIAAFEGTRQLIDPSQSGNTIGANTLVNNGVLFAPPAPQPSTTTTTPTGTTRAVRAWRRSPRAASHANLRHKPVSTKQATPVQASPRQQRRLTQPGVLKARFARFK